METTVQQQLRWAANILAMAADLPAGEARDGLLRIALRHLEAASEASLAAPEKYFRVLPSDIW
jgi:hypothetical protein